MIILPSTASTLDALLSKLTDERLIQYTAFSARDVDVKLPKFTARLDIDLDPVFRMVCERRKLSDLFKRVGCG